MFILHQIRSHKWPRQEQITAQSHEPTAVFAVCSGRQESGSYLEQTTKQPGIDCSQTLKETLHMPFNFDNPMLVFGLECKCNYWWKCKQRLKKKQKQTKLKRCHIVVLLSSTSLQFDKSPHFTTNEMLSKCKPTSGKDSLTFILWNNEANVRIGHKDPGWNHHLLTGEKQLFRTPTLHCVNNQPEAFKVPDFTKKKTLPIISEFQ